MSVQNNGSVLSHGVIIPFGLLIGAVCGVVMMALGLI